MSLSGLSIAHDHHAGEFVGFPRFELIFEIFAFFGGSISGGFSGSDAGFEFGEEFLVVCGREFEEGRGDSDSR